MSVKSMLKRLAEAAPVIAANAPAVIAAAKEVKRALRKPRAEPSDKRVNS